MFIFSIRVVRRSFSESVAADIIPFHFLAQLLSIQFLNPEDVGANLDISWAGTHIVKNLEKHEKRDLLAWLLTQSERVYQYALNANQFSASQGALKLIYDMMTMREPEKKKDPRWHGNYKY